MNEQTFKLLKIWLENAPESYHPNDMERFYDFVSALLEYDDGVLNSDKFFKTIREVYPEWSQEYSEEFLTLWEGRIEVIVGFIHYTALK